MTTTNMQKRIISHTTVVVAIVTVVIGATIGVVILTHKYSLHSRSSKDNKSQQAAALPSPFSADPPQGWRTGPSNDTSIALFGPDNVCFVSMEYRRGAVDVPSELAKVQADSRALGGESVKQSISKMSMNINGVEKQYDLNLFKQSGAQALRIMGGLAVGYVQLADGHITAKSNCNDFDKLTTTFDTLKSMKFKQ